MKVELVDLGIKKVKIPVAQIIGKHEGKKLLITAGSDGDEYAGIEAAYKIIEQFSSGYFSGRLTVIPILNIPGFEAMQGKNPLDNKYPKRIFPGKQNGSASERLIDWFVENYLDSAELWLDLHGGGIAEILDPYVCLYETKNQVVNKIVTEILRNINSPKITYERPGAWRKVDLLAKKGIAYIIAEAGCSGERDEEMIKKHIEWTKTIMRALGMTERDEDTPGVALDDSPGVEESVKPHIYRQIRSYKTKYSGLWYPEPAGTYKKGQILGIVKSLGGKILDKIIAKDDGEYLWVKQGLSSQNGEVLIEIGYEKIDIDFFKKEND